MLGRRLRRLKIVASVLLLLVIPVLSAVVVAADNPAEDSATAQFLQARSIAPVDFSSDGNRTPAEPLLVAQQKKPPSPFEEVPEEQTPQRKPPSPFEDVEEEAEEAAPTRRGPLLDVIESIQFRGTRRIPRDSLLARIFTKAGDVYDEANLRRDFMVLWNSGYFDDLRLEVEDGDRGKIVRFIVVERRVVRTIRYEGNKSATVSDILERFKERKVGLSVESRYDPTRVQRAVIVLRELLGERGRQYAKVTPDVRQIPPSSIEIVFNIEEGPKVKVGKLNFEGNQVMSAKALRGSMKNLRPMGLPHSFILEKMFKKTFDIRKLEEDKERVRNAYQMKGHFKAAVLNHDLNVRDQKGRRIFPIPLLWKKKAKLADVKLFLEEGDRYYRGKLSFTDVKLFRTPEAVLGPVFQMEENSVFDIEKLRKGLENLKKLYGEFGYIDFVAEPNFEFRDDEDPPKIDLNFIADEGKQFFVRRINFSGNTTTRDKVIRREIMLDEGDMFNTRLWDLSMLRLNQLGYFEPIKEEEGTDIRRDTRQGLVDLTLNVKERGRNTVSLNGGVSGFAGSFIGFGYSTNNFLGLGERLGFEAQLGSRERVLLFSFTEPYLFNRPIQAGFTVFSRRFSFNQAREASIFSGANLIPLFNALGRDNILDYRQNSTGFNTFASYPLRKLSFTRLSVSYGFQKTRLTTFSRSAENLFTFLNFEGVDGPNSLEGITTSEITPGIFYNTVNHPITPSAGKSLFANVAVAGFGGNTRFMQPTAEAKYFKKVSARGNVIGMRLLFSFLTGYGGRVPPPFRRSFMGGENDIRGFEIFSIVPMAWIPDTATVPVLNGDGTLRQQIVIREGIEQLVPVTQTVPIFRLNFPGGDTRMVYNLEYRIPLFGPVTVAPFFDIGFNKILLKNQVRLNAGRVAELNAQFPQVGFERRIRIIPETQKMRASTGVELQVMMPVVNAPFRFYWAYNPLRVNTFLRTPIVADRSSFPNAQSFLAGIQPFGRILPFFEKARTVRFTISRTF